MCIYIYIITYIYVYVYIYIYIEREREIDRYTSNIITSIGEIDRLHRTEPHRIIKETETNRRPQEPLDFRNETNRNEPFFVISALRGRRQNGSLKPKK